MKINALQLIKYVASCVFTTITVVTVKKMPNVIQECGNIFETNKWSLRWNFALGLGKDAVKKVGQKFDEIKPDYTSTDGKLVLPDGTIPGDYNGPSTTRNISEDINTIKNAIVDTACDVKEKVSNCVSKTIDNVENISEGIKDTIGLLNYSGDDKNSKGMFDENLFSNMNKSFDDDDDFYDFLVSGEDSSVELPKEDKVNKSDRNHTSEMLETSEGSHNFDKLHRRL